MPIEPLNLTLADYEDTDHEILEKINELIDAINNDGYYLAQPHHISVEIKDIKERLKVLENATQPKEKESKLLDCPWCSITPTLFYKPYFKIECENRECHIQPFTPECNTKQEAISAWNSRK